MNDKKKKQLMTAGLLLVIVAALLILYLFYLRRGTMVVETNAPLPQVGGDLHPTGSGDYTSYNFPPYSPSPFPILGPRDLGMPNSGSGGCCETKCGGMVGGIKTPSLPMWSSLMYGG